MKKFTLSCMLAAVLAGAGVENISAVPLKFNAAVSYPAHNAGMYSFSTDEYNPELIQRNIYASGGGYAYNDEYYGIRFEVIMGIPAISRTSYYMLRNWTEDDSFTGQITDVATDYAYNEDRDQMFGCFMNEDGASFNFSSVNPAYFGHTKICDLPKGWGACDFDKNGTLYAIDEDGGLFTVNYRNGEMTKVGDTGLVTEWITGGIIDKESNAMIYSVKNSSESALYFVDLATAKATKIYDLANEEQVGGMFFPKPEVNPGVPAKLSSTPSVSVSGMVLDAKVQFRMPTTTADGNAATGDLKYHVYANGKEVATGESSYGAGYVTVSFSVPESDTYSIGVRTENSVGMSEISRASVKFIGQDTPKAPASVTISGYTDGKLSLRWGSVSSGVNSGTIDRANLIYRVTRYPDAKVVSAADLKTTSMVDELPMPAERTEYYYTVEAITGDLKSAPTASAPFSIGTITPPAVCEFVQNSDLFGFSILNPGTDTNKWQLNTYGKCVYVRTSALQANAWIVTPPVNLKAQNSYEISVKVKGYSTSYTETVNVMAGLSADPEALTIPVISGEQFKTSDYVTLSGKFIPEKDGVYYIGVQAASNQGGYIYMENITIGEAQAANAPADATGLKAEADPAGKHIVTVTGTAPALTLSGSTLTSITKTELLRDGEVIKTITSGIEPGKEFSITDDTEPAAGVHTYGVRCSNAAGTGPVVSAEVTVGFAAPVPVAEIRVTDTDNPSVVTADWDAVVSDSEGRALTPADVTYTVWTYSNGEQTLVAENIKETSLEINVEIPEGKQAFYQVLVQATTEGGSSKIVPSNLTPLGTPYPAPWTESFSDKQLSSILGQRVVNGDDYFTLSSGHDTYGVYPADNDGGMLYFEGYGTAETSFFTGKIDLGDLESPAFIIYVYNFYTSGDNENTVKIEVNPGTGFNNELEMPLFQTGERNQWNKIIVPLDNYAGQVVQIRVTAATKKYAFHYFDKMMITSVVDHNLAISNFTAPTSVDRNTAFNIAVTVENRGINPARNYNVNLYRNGALVDTKKGSELQPEESNTFEFSQKLDASAPDENVYYAEIEYGLDMIESDNISAEQTVTARLNALPEVTDLTATADKENITLSWSAPSAKNVLPVTLNLDEEELAWGNSLPGWKFIDNDKGTIIGIGSRKIPVSGRQSFFIINNTHESLQNSNGTPNTPFNAHSGNQYLCSMVVGVGNEMIPSDDWAISPELTGKAQTVSVWATSFLATGDSENQYLETFEILYSTTGTDMEDFILVERFRDIPAVWKKYYAYLPDGAKYFAIRCVSQDKYMLFVDDITFTPKDGDTETVKPEGYNIYRNGSIFTAEPVSETTFTDKDVTEGNTYKYNVTALYNKVESRLSNDAEIYFEGSGVDGIAANAITIEGGEGVITVRGAEGKLIRVYSADGRAATSAAGTGLNRIRVVPGLYLVRAGEKMSAKVIVK